ncbi:MAG: hypothetical protein ACPGO5_01525 [Patescibacteria group bacterium]
MRVKPETYSGSQVLVWKIYGKIFKERMKRGVKVNDADVLKQRAGEYKFWSDHKVIAFDISGATINSVLLWALVSIRKRIVKYPIRLQLDRKQYAKSKAIVTMLSMSGYSVVYNRDAAIAA